MEKHDLRRLQIEDLKLIGPLLGHWISFYFTNLLIPLHSCNIWLIGGGIDGCIDHFSMQNRVTHHIYISFRPDWHLPSNVWLCLSIRDIYHPISYICTYEHGKHCLFFFIFYFPSHRTCMIELDPCNSQDSYVFPWNEWNDSCPPYGVLK